MLTYLCNEKKNVYTLFLVWKESPGCFSLFFFLCVFMMVVVVAVVARKIVRHQSWDMSTIWPSC